MKVNTMITAAGIWIGQLLNCCSCLSATEERTDTIREHLVQQLTTRAAFDVGSGDLKITVCDVDPQTNKIVKIWLQKFTPVTLRKDLAQNPDGCLSQKVEDELIKSIKELQQEASQFHPQKWVGVATSVFRTAKNGQEFLDRVNAATGADIQIIPQVEEGKIGFASAVAASDLSPENVISWDSGFGSFQLSAMIDGKLEMYGAEFAFISTMEALFAARNQPYSPDISLNPINYVEALELIETIRSKLPPITPWLASNNKKVIAIGGMSIFTYGEKVLGRTSFTKDELLVAIHEHSGKSDEHLSQFGNPKHVITALVLMYAIMEHCGFEEMTHCLTNGSCEGLAISPHYWNAGTHAFIPASN